MTTKDSTNNSEKRKTHHIEFARQAQTHTESLNRLFDYEPLCSGFPSENIVDLPRKIGKKQVRFPLWISSMTGGTGKAGPINKRLAKVAGEYGIGMGLGSCRPLLESDQYFDDFNLRPLIGEKGVLFANFGLAQIEQQIQKDAGKNLIKICKKLDVDGVFIHVNPLQEWYQPEGDRWFTSPLKVIERVSDILHEADFLLGVKEVGQGMGPKSIESVLRGPCDILEFGAYGGTNFSLLELLRTPESLKNTGQENIGKRGRELCYVGHTAGEMVYHVNRLNKEINDLGNSKTFIVSGGIRSFLEGYFLLENLEGNGLYAMAKPFLAAANEGESSLRQFVQSELEGLTMAKAFLRAKPLDYQSMMQGRQI